MKPAAFRFERATTQDAAMTLLAEHGDACRLLAGGQSLVPVMAKRLVQPAVLVDINGLSDLASVAQDDGGTRVGALVRHGAIERMAACALPLLALAVPLVAHPTIRNRGTVGGSVAWADPAGEIAAACVCLDAEIDLASAARGSRSVPGPAFFLGRHRTACAADEMVTAIRLPAVSPDRRHAIRELTTRPNDSALAGVAVAADLREGRLSDVRVVAFGVADHPVRADRTAAVLDGAAIDDADACRAARACLRTEITPRADAQLTADQRASVAGVLLARALQDIRHGATA